MYDSFSHNSVLGNKKPEKNGTEQYQNKMKGKNKKRKLNTI